MQQKLSKVFGLNMIVVGMVIGFSLVATYAIPTVKEASAANQEGYLAFQSTCTACHGADRVQNFQGSSSWPEIIDLMKSYGAFIQPEEEEQIRQYLEETYPKGG